MNRMKLISIAELPTPYFKISRVFTGTFIDTLNNNHVFKVSFKFEKQGIEWGYPISVYFSDNYGGDYRLELVQLIWQAVRAKLLFNVK